MCIRDRELERQRRHHFPFMPLISVVVPAYHTPEVFLREMIESLEPVSYTHLDVYKRQHNLRTGSGNGGNRSRL